jgi:uncharacterized protein (TIGR02453 family)
MAAPYFTRELFRFLLELDGNNDRAWFEANRDRYDAHYKDAALRFVADFAPRLHIISPHLRVEPRVGGSLFRIYRDTRFSHDKLPYKTHCAMHLRHESAQDAHAPAYYLHLEPGECIAAHGIWRPDGAPLRRLREAIAARGAEWQQILAAEARHGRWQRFGDRLKRVPRGFPADHPLASELMFKDFGSFRTLTQREVLARDFPERYAEMCAVGAPMMRFICEGLGLRF